MIKIKKYIANLTGVIGRPYIFDNTSVYSPPPLYEKMYNIFDNSDCLNSVLQSIEHGNKTT